MAKRLSDCPHYQWSSLIVGCQAGGGSAASTPRPVSLEPRCNRVPSGDMHTPRLSELQSFSIVPMIKII